MEENQASYRQIFKATSLFGGVQVFNIIISIIRSKFVAILIGPTGMGITGLLTTSIGFVSALTNFGLGTSAVKNVAAAAATGDESRVSTVVTVLRRLVWITGLLGMVLTAVLSPWLSDLTFGNKDYTLAFIWISVTLLFQQLSSGQIVVLQGLRRLQYLAKANMAGAVFGLVISIPVYYVWRLDGIVPVIIISSLTAMLLSWFYARKVGVRTIKINTKTITAEGKEMLKMGFVLSISGLIPLGTSYIIRIYISNIGGVDQVGLYTAGFAIINTYVGMIFSAMSMDYYPRLAGVAHDNKKTAELINQQSEIAILILAPILAVFIVFIQYVIILLYSTKFVPVNGMIQWAAMGMYFKAVSWAIAFILLAKGASRLFFWNELIANIYILGFNIIGYKLAGFNGLGISFLAGYFVYLIQVFLLARYKYEFLFQIDFFKLFGIQLILGIACFTIIRFLQTPWSYFTGGATIVFSTWLSIKELDKRLGLKAIWINFRSRF